MVSFTTSLSTKECEVPMRTKVFAVIGAAVILTSLTACSSSSKSSSSKQTASCTMLDGWMPLPSNFNVDHMSSKLQVSAERVRNGTAGPANCSSAISIDKIGSSDAPLVTIIGHKSKCLPFGTQDKPTPGGTTKMILAVCPTD